MSRTEEKLTHFADDVMSDVGEERRGLVEKLDEQLRDKYAEKETEYLAEAYEIIQGALTGAEQRKKESLSRIVMGNRNKLFNKRNDILKNVYAKTMDELIAFKESDAYKTHLLKKISHGKEVLGEGDIWVKLNYSDRDLQDFIETKTGLNVAIESKKIQLIGGCIIQNRTSNIIMDESFSRRLDDSREGFIQQCQLEIN